jgi:hypothetical protein
MDPLFPFGTLATDIEHAICQVAELENGLGDASGP